MKSTVACLCLILSLLFFGCSENPNAPWEATLSDNFSFQLVGELNGVEMRATVSAASIQADSEGLFRLLTVTYSEPASLRGVTVQCRFYPVTKQAADISLSCDGLLIPNAEVDDLLFPVLMLVTVPENAVLRREKNGKQMLSDTAMDERVFLFASDGSPLECKGRYGSIRGQWKLAP